MGGKCSTEEYDDYQIAEGHKDAHVELHAVNSGSINNSRGSMIIMNCGSEASTSSLSDRQSTKEEKEGGWGYGEKDGPHIWKENYPQCDGVRQSPVNIEPEKAVTLPDKYCFSVEPKTMRSVFGSAHDLLAIKDTKMKSQNFIFHYQNGGAICTNDGKAVTICMLDAGSIRIFNDEPFPLIQFHFHTPSEHTLDGKQYPLEMQLVHQHEQTGELAIVSHLFELGEADPLLHDLMRGRPPPKLDQSYRIKLVDWDLLPGGRENYIHYEGSLTQPPCTEGIAWFVNTDVTTCDQEQIDWLKESIPYSNSRPIQHLNDRPLRACQASVHCNLVE